MSHQQLIKPEDLPQGGRIVRQESSHDESSSSYAIPGGQAQEMSRGASSTLQAEIPGGHLSQQNQQKEFKHESKSVQEQPAGGSTSTRRVSQTQRSSSTTSSSHQSVKHQTSSGDLLAAAGGVEVPDGLQMASPQAMMERQRKEFERQQQQMMEQQRQMMGQDQDVGRRHVTMKSQQTVQKQVTQQQKTIVQSQGGTGSTTVVDGRPGGMIGGQTGTPPVFEQIFKNARFAQGGDALFQGRVRGSPRPTVSWSRQGRVIADSSKYQLQYSQTTGDVSLLITRIGPGDEGEYTCTAANRCGEAVCTVYIQPEAAFQRQLEQTQKMSQKKSMQQTTSTTDSCGRWGAAGSVERHQHYQRTEDFKADTFEYRLIREVEFRESLTRRQPGEVEAPPALAVSGPLSPPQVQAKPRATKVQQGADATFQARVDGCPVPRVTWFFNGVRVQQGTRTALSHSGQLVSLSLKDVRVEDTGHYTMLAENQAGCVVSTAFLAVEAPPSPPAAAAHSSGNFTKQRLQQTMQQPRQPANLDFSEVDTSVMPVKEEVIETRSLAPSFLKVPSDQQVQESKLVRLECRTAGKPAPEVSWFINGIQVVNDATHKLLVNEAGNHALLITAANTTDAGPVTCLAKNKSGEVSHQITLNVMEKEQMMAPKFVERFQACRVLPGEAVSMSCRAVGSPTPRLSWQRDGQPIDSSDHISIMTEGGASVLDIPSVRTEDAAWYQCTAQNAAGSTATRAKLYINEASAQPAAEPWRLQLPKPTKVIEPEPAATPEVVHLRHVERSRPRQQQAPEERAQPPPQFTYPLRDTSGYEGDRILLEARVTPLSDPAMKLEWFVNGTPLPASSRATLTYKFGYVSLSLLSVIAEDSGVYVCRASNQAGTDETSCQVNIRPRAAVENAPQHPEIMQQIRRLEDSSSQQDRSVGREEHRPSQPPRFVRDIRDVIGAREDTSIRFEGQVEPADDSHMDIEWFKDGHSITAGSRLTASSNFGFVSLNINHLREDDSGTYTARASNKAGEAFSQAQLTVEVSEQKVTADLGIPEQQKYIQSVEQLETHKQTTRQQMKVDDVDSIAPPRFTQPIKDSVGVPETGTAHFEARLEPVGDSSLQVDWFKDGKILEAGSRITTFFNFGYVSLTMKQVLAQDSGVYTCVARNAAGQAQCEAMLQCVTRRDVVSEGRMEGLEKLQYLEDSSRHQRKVEEDTQVVKIPPRFLGPIKGTNVIRESQTAHFEARLEPQNDTTMQIDWMLNGKPLPSASRIQTYHDFGYVALDISAALPEDSGSITIIAKNQLGQAQAQTDLRVEARSAVDSSSIHRGVVEKTSHLEKSKHKEPSYDVGDYCRSKPVFTVPLQDPPPQMEGGSAHLECRLEPLNDPTMVVEWFLNGRAVTVGSRLRTYHDFGVVALDVLDLSVCDAGEYTARATNQLGSAHTSAMLQVVSRAGILTETQNVGALEQIQQLEGSGRRSQMETETDVNMAPNFVKTLKNIESVEGSNIHMEGRLHPVGDNSMKLQWFVNDQPLKNGHRFRPAYDFDYVALDLLRVYPDDSGIYTCKATNNMGQAVTSASVRVISKKDIYTQHPGALEQIQYIEDSSRLQRKEWTDEVASIKPKFLSQLKHLENMKEGQSAHFEARLEPVADSSLQVEWLKDGKPIAVGHRHRPIHDFGYVALDILGVIEEDSGIYTCRAINSVGVDETSAILKSTSGRKILTSTEHEVNMSQFRSLEDKSRYSRSEAVEELTTQAPVFTSSLTNISVKEGQRAHFESRLIPVSDHTMTVQWFHNGHAVKAGSRFAETNSFGFVALDILQTTAEDQGTYTCKATNALGEAVTQASLTCSSRSTVESSSLHEQALHKLQRLEQKQLQTTSTSEELVSQAPVFTQPIKDVRVAEGQPLHFEAKLIPVGDSKLHVDWFKNGVPLQPANRISTVHDFGFVSLDMKYTQEDDSATYTCRATNELGQAATSAAATVVSKQSQQLENQSETTLAKLRYLEDKTIRRTEIEETTVTEKPRFITELSGLNSLMEGQSAHMEARIGPYPDTNMKVEWLHNGKPLAAGHRYRTVCDFGLISLDVLSAYPEDSGEYTARITNKLGSAVSSLQIIVQPRGSLIQEPQHPAAMKHISQLEAQKPCAAEATERAAEAPVFGRPLRNAALLEGQTCHLEATLVPVNDPHMKVEWFHNGRPIHQGHRFKTTFDFGYVALDLLYAYPEDSGTYMCKATNLIGEAVSTCDVRVDGKQSLLLDTLDSGRLQKLQNLESPVQQRPEEATPVPQKPVFVTPLNNLDKLREGDHVHLECRLEPVHDPKLKVTWLVNGKEIKTGHRFRSTHDFGYVALDILYAYAEDSGTYMCKATNEVGEAVNTCTVTINAHRSLYLDTQHPEGLQKIHDLEHRQPQRMEEVDAPQVQPRFVQPLRGPTQLKQHGVARMEGRIEPAHDPQLRVEWFHNDQPLQSASRFHSTCDFGYVSLNVRDLVPEDSGTYTCKAINRVGEAVSTLDIQVSGQEGVEISTQHPQGLEAIRQLESRPEATRAEEAVSFQKPMFTQPLQSVDGVQEGCSVHLEARLVPVGDPNLRVDWFRNEVPLELGSRIKPVHDFGYVALDISGLRPEDEGVYMCRATNQLGEAMTTASIKIQSGASIVLDSQHPDSMGKLAELERKPQPQLPAADQLFEKPVFTMPLSGADQLREGQSARFEARCVPVGDPHLKFDWYHNGLKLGLGSRIQETHDFGFVTLDILGVTPSDAGVYKCRAVNLAGEDVTTTSLHVHDGSAVLGDAIRPSAWDKIQSKEAEMNRVPEQRLPERADQAPVFTAHLESHDRLVEQQTVHLEATVEPKTDPYLRVEWYKNGAPLMTGTRLRSTFDFGLVTLDIMDLRGDDSGIYNCRAVNRAGEAVTTCTLKVEDKHWLLGDSLRPEALSAIAGLESARAGSDGIAADAVFQLPVFVSHLNNVECGEDAIAHFECRVEPAKDPTLKIEWFWNGEPMKSASRYSSNYEFGFITLDISGTQTSDSGLLVCKATNSEGSAQTSGVLKVKSGVDIVLDTVHPAGQRGLETVEKMEASQASKLTSQKSLVETPFPKPWFIVPLQPEFQLGETQPLHLQCNVEPKEDPRLTVEWYFNGQPLTHATRFRMSDDFGFVQLDLGDVYPRDQGIYTCRAFNQAGEAFTTTTVTCTGKTGLIDWTQHPKGQLGLEAIQELEDARRRGEGPPLTEEEGHPPVFTSQFQNLTNLSEGDVAHFEATLTPVGDETMKVEWFYNSKPLKAGNRLRTVNAFGMVVLEIVGTKMADSGQYTCRATNRWGQAEISVTLECVDKASGEPPRFNTQIQDVEGLRDGDSAHFECRLTPVNDQNLRVEWLHNGQPLRHSTRIKCVSDFGFVLLDVAYVQPQDSGEYVCRATNRFGRDETRAQLRCRGDGGVQLDTLQPQSLSAIRSLEQLQPGVQSPPPPALQPPRFTKQLDAVDAVLEGHSAHLEARLTPVDDPDLKVEWFRNGVKLPTGHRFRTFHDFGIVILDILYCYESDSGVYECRAVNKLGSDSTQATVRCSSKAGLVLTPQMPKEMAGGLEKIQNLEDASHLKRQEREEVQTSVAPRFTLPFENLDNVREGENAHFEARLTPKDDTKLKTEWYHNGRPLKASSRFRTFCDFGFVILEISPVYPEDSGTYMCRAVNEAGEATTSATMKCSGKQGIVLETQLPQGMESTMEKIAQLEGLGIRPSQPEEKEEGAPPQFVTQPEDLSLQENQTAHFECRLTPATDPTLRVEWYHNGRALSTGSRIKTINDFGYVILEIGGIYQRDAGVYTCKAINKHGEASVTCSLTVKTRQNIVMDPQRPQGMDGIRSLEESLQKSSKTTVTEDQEKPNPPRFLSELQSLEDLLEGQPARFDCRVEPVGDPSMRIEWFRNGKYMDTGSRMHSSDDFGFVVLELDWTMPRDSGEYMCRATNKWGSAYTKAMLVCKAKRDIDLGSQLPRGLAGEKLMDLEKGPESRTSEKPEVEAEPPRFTKEIESVDVGEGETAFFDCQVEPKTDPRLRVEWFHNGKLLQVGHRYRTTFDFGYSSLQILGVYPEDAGQYSCRAVNRSGEASCSSSLTCRAISSVIMLSNATKSVGKADFMAQMERALKKYTDQIHLTEDDIFDVERKQPPRFVTQIESQLDLSEMAQTKFECQLAPVGDPNMKVEWFLNGRPLPYKNRFTPIYDFGYVAMKFGWLYPEDSGEYVCRATNLYGMDETRAVIETKGKPGIVYDSQLPAGMQSVQLIQQLETEKNRAAASVSTTTDELSAAPPLFVTKPESVRVTEGDWSRFCCRVTGYPRPRVLWLINGNSIVNGTRYKLTYDGMWRLDIPKTRQYDSGKVEVIARNSAGEAYCSCTVHVQPRQDDYRSVLKNAPKPWYDLDRPGSEVQDGVQRRALESLRPTSGGAALLQGDHRRTDLVAEETEWQQQARSRHSQDHYSAYKQLDENQVLKEVKSRESSHQFSVPGDRITDSSVAKGMATAYMENIASSEREVEKQAPPLRKPFVPAVAESTVSGKEVHTTVQRQQQKETRGDLEIQRNITATETQQVEHSAQTHERVVQGKVEPSRPPSFTRKLQPCRVSEKDGARFEVEFDGDPAPSIDWFRENFHIKSSADFKITTTQRRSTLEIREVFAEDSGQFSCVASNRGGKARSSANLLVESRRTERGAGASPPSFSSTVQDCCVAPGQPARLQCRLHASKPVDVYWLQNGQPVVADYRHKIREDDDVFTLTILETSSGDIANYECVAINSHGEARCQAELSVKSNSSAAAAAKPSRAPPASASKTDTAATASTKSSQQQEQQQQEEQPAAQAPKISEPMKALIVQEGQPAEFRCKFTGNPAPSVQWLKDEKPVLRSKYVSMEKQGDAFLLKFRQCFPEDEGTYYCVATNAAGRSTMKAPLKVTVPRQDVAPTVSSLQSVDCTEGEKANFSAKITGKPTPVVTWLRESTVIPRSEEFKMFVRGNVAHLEIVETYEEDTGRITCRATNSAGTAESSAQLKVNPTDESD